MNTQSVTQPMSIPRIAVGSLESRRIPLIPLYDDAIFVNLDPSHVENALVHQGWVRKYLTPGMSIEWIIRGLGYDVACRGPFPTLFIPSRGTLVVFHPDILDEINVWAHTFDAVTFGLDLFDFENALIAAGWKRIQLKQASFKLSIVEIMDEIPTYGVSQKIFQSSCGEAVFCHKSICDIVLDIVYPKLLNLTAVNLPITTDDLYETLDLGVEFLTNVPIIPSDDIPNTPVHTPIDYDSMSPSDLLTPLIGTTSMNYGPFRSTKTNPVFLSHQDHEDGYHPKAKRSLSF